MFAKVKKTGVIVDVEFSHKDDTGEISFYKDLTTNEMYDKNGLVFINEKKPTSEIDWEQRRFELVKAATQGMLANRQYVSAAYERATKTRAEIEFVVAVNAVRYADAIILKLKEE